MKDQPLPGQDPVSDTSAGTSPQPVGTVRLTREIGFGDIYRDYTVLLDGQRVGKIAAGGLQEYPVQPGDHTIRLRIDWTGSTTLAFDVGAGETRDFVCRSRPAFLAAVEFVRSFVQRDRWIVLEAA